MPGDGDQASVEPDHWSGRRGSRASSGLWAIASGPAVPLQCECKGSRATVPGQSRVQGMPGPADVHGTLWRWKEGL